MDEILVSEAAAIVQPAITNNSRSNFVIVWGVRNGGRLVGALFDLQGQPVSGEFEVSQGSGDLRRFPVAAHMASPAPGFAVAWIEGNPERVMVRRFDREGTAFGPPLRASSGLPLPGFGPALARAPDGNSIVCWVGEDTAVHAMTFAPDGKARGENFVVSPAGMHLAPVRVVGLENNSFAVCWLSGQAGSAGNVMLQILDTTGARVGEPRLLDLSNVGSAFAMAPIVRSASGGQAGHFAVAYVSSAFPGGAGGAGGGQRTVIGTVFGPTGERLEGGPFNITQRERNTVASNPAMTALPSGRFLVTWSERPIPDMDEKQTGDDIKAMLCDERLGALPGSRLPGLIPAIDVTASLAGQQVLPAAAFAIDAETGHSAIAVVWLDDGSRDGSAGTHRIKARLLGPAAGSPV